MGCGFYHCLKCWLLPEAVLALPQKKTDFLHIVYLLPIKCNFHTRACEDHILTQKMDPVIIPTQGRREPVRVPGYFIAPGPGGQSFSYRNKLLRAPDLRPHLPPPPPPLDGPAPTQKYGIAIFMKR